MVRLNKIYTKTGDNGTTALGDGTRTQKFSLRVVAYGTVDELNSNIGVARLYVSNDLTPKLKNIQNDLFDLGADLCNPIKNDTMPSKHKDLRIVSRQTERIETQIDAMNASLKPLTSFILPGGGFSSAHLHICRTVCRRAERYAVELASKEFVNQEALKYLNRLSDWFFVACRFENIKNNGDINWIPGENR